MEIKNELISMYPDLTNSHLEIDYAFTNLYWSNTLYANKDFNKFSL